MRTSKYLLVSAVVLSLPAAAMAATRLNLCPTLPCPVPVPTLPPLTVPAGVSFSLVVSASDGSGIDESYTGTVQFATSDPPFLRRTRSSLEITESSRSPRCFAPVGSKPLRLRMHRAE